MKRKIDRFTQLANELFHLLEEKEEQIRALKERQADPETEWMQPRIFKRNSNRLPVPRLELRCHNSGDWSHYTWMYGLFYQHQEGHYLLLPTWMSKVSSGAGKPVRNGRPQIPRNAEILLKHDMEHFRLPGYVIVDDVVETIASAPDANSRAKASSKQ